MEKVQALHLLKGALVEIADSRGYARTDDFSGLREVDAKVREVRMIIEGIDGFAPLISGVRLSCLPISL